MTGSKPGYARNEADYTMTTDAFPGGRTENDKCSGKATLRETFNIRED
jgi:hypothetical protein